MTVAAFTRTRASLTRPTKLFFAPLLLAAALLALPGAGFSQTTSTLSAAPVTSGSEQLIGSWSAKLRPITLAQSTQTIALKLDVAPDLSVTGKLGNAELVNARLQRHPWAYRKLLRHKTEWNIQGELKGNILSPADNRGWDRVYIHLRQGELLHTISASVTASVDWGKGDMMPMRPVTLKKVEQYAATKPAGAAKVRRK